MSHKKKSPASAGPASPPARLAVDNPRLRTPGEIAFEVITLLQAVRTLSDSPAGSSGEAHYQALRQRAIDGLDELIKLFRGPWS